MADPKWNYKIKFDSSLGLDEIWIDSQTLDFLNSFRENIYVSQNFPIMTDIAAPPIPIPTTTPALPSTATRTQPKRHSKVQLGTTTTTASVETKSTAALSEETRRSR